MSLTFRRVLFAFFSFLFLIAGSVIVLYGLGWRINWEDFQLQKTGAIAVKTNPRGVIIKLDNKKYADESSIIQNHTLISDLTPKTYFLTVEKDGFRTYQKKLKIKPSMVETVDIFLVPDKIKEETGVSSLKGDSIIDVSADSQKIITKTSVNGNYYLYNLQNPKSALNIRVLATNLTGFTEIKKALFVPFDSNQILIETKSGIEILDVSRSQIEKLIDGKVALWNLYGSTIYFIKAKTGESGSFSVFSYNLIFKTQNKIFDIASSTVKSPLVDLKTSGQGRVAFLDSSQSLYLFSGGGLVEKIADSAKFFAFSPNNKALAFLDNDGTINIFFIDGWEQVFRKKDGAISRFDLPSKQNFTKLFWYEDSLRIFTVQKNKVSLTEIDERPPLNYYEIETEIDDFLYSNSAFAYIIKNNNLQKLTLQE